MRKGRRKNTEDGKLQKKTRKKSGRSGNSGSADAKNEEKEQKDQENGGGTKKGPKRSSQKGRGRKPKQKKKSDAEVIAAELDTEGTPLYEEVSLQRPKVPVKPAEPEVIEIPAPKEEQKEPEKRDSDKKEKSSTPKKKSGKSKASSTAKAQEKKSESSAPEGDIVPVPEGFRDDKWVALSDVPREFPINIDQRVGIFVDVQNMFYTAKYKYNRKIDYKRLIEEIARGRKVTRALAYMVQAPEIDQTQFKHILDKLGFELRIKDLRVRADGTAKGDWDMGIAIDSISLKDKVDVIALVSGDGDFTDLVYMLRSNGLRVEVYSFPSNTSEDLIQAATYYYPLEQSILMKW